MVAFPTPSSGPCSPLERHVVLVRQSTCIAYAERLRAAQTWPIIGRSGDKRKVAGTWVLSLFHALVKVRRCRPKGSFPPSPRSTIEVELAKAYEHQIKRFQKSRWSRPKYLRLLPYHLIKRPHRECRSRPFLMASIRLSQSPRTTSSSDLAPSIVPVLGV
jgi:hypothetical protein